MAAQPDHRPARHRFALAPSRLAGNLAVRITWPLARRTSQDQQRGPCAYLPNEPRQFLMGRAADSWRTAQTRIRRIAGHGVALHAVAELSAPPALAHLLAQPSARAWWIDFRNAGRISDQLVNLVRGWFERIARCCAKVRDSGLIESPWILHLWWPTRTSTDHRATRGYIPVNPRCNLKGSAYSTKTDRRLSPYRSRASPRTEAAGIAEICRIPGCRAYDRGTPSFYATASRSTAVPSERTISQPFDASPASAWIKF